MLDQLRELVWSKELLSRFLSEIYVDGVKQQLEVAMGGDETATFCGHKREATLIVEVLVKPAICHSASSHQVL